MTGRPTRKRGPRGGPWRCHTCGHVTTAYAPIERHVDQEHRHGRIEVLFTIRVLVIVLCVAVLATAEGLIGNTP